MGYQNVNPDVLLFDGSRGLLSQFGVPNNLPAGLNYTSTTSVVNSYFGGEIALNDVDFDNFSSMALGETQSIIELINGNKITVSKLTNNNHFELSIKIGNTTLACGSADSWADCRNHMTMFFGDTGSSISLIWAMFNSDRSKMLTASNTSITYAQWEEFLNDAIPLPEYHNGAGSGYIGNSLLSNKKMVGYNVPTSSVEGTKTESVQVFSLTPLANTPKAGNGFVRITWLRDLPDRYIFRTNPEVMVDTLTLDVPNAELVEEGIIKGLTYKIYDNDLCVITGVQTEAFTQDDAYYNRLRPGRYNRYIYIANSTLIGSNFFYRWVSRHPNVYGNLTEVAFNTVNIINSGNYFFEYCANLQYVNFENFSFANNIQIQSFFGGCSSLNNVDMSNVDLNYVITTAGMFGGCSSLDTLNLGDTTLNSVQDIDNMFRGTAFEEIDLSNFNLVSVKMRTIFSDCTNLRKIKFPNLINSANDTFGWMFRNCINLEEIDYNGFKINCTSSRNTCAYLFYNCKKFTSINIRDLFITNLVFGVENASMFEGCDNLQYLDLNDTEFHFNFSSSLSNCEDTMLKDCNSLIEIKCPATIQTHGSGEANHSATLPFTMYDNYGNAYTTLPDHNITIYKNPPPPKPQPTTSEHLTANVSANVSVKGIGYYDEYMQEHISARVSANVSFMGVGYYDEYTNEHLSANVNAEVTIIQAEDIQGE